MSMPLINKADIIEGKNNIQKFDFKTLKGALKLRPLTDGESHKVNALMKNGGLMPLRGQVEAKPKNKRRSKDNEDEERKTNIDYEIDPMVAEEARYEADVKAIYFSMQHPETKEGETWTEDEIMEHWPAGSVDEVAKKVYEISGLEDPNETRNKVEDFRKDKSESSD